jgi:hypothetical protein
VLEIVRSGKAKALAEVGSWGRIMAPAGTLQPVIAALNSEINKLLTTEGMKCFSQGEGAAPDQFGDLIPQRNRALDQGRAPAHESFETWSMFRGVGCRLRRRTARCHAAAQRPLVEALQHHIERGDEHDRKAR